MNPASPLVPTPDTPHPAPTLYLPNSAASVPTAVDLLKAGRLIAFPTETVYGIAFNLRSPAARAHIKTLKNLDTSNSLWTGWVLHFGRPEEALAHLPDLPPLAHRLILKTSPGPIAFQLPISAETAASLAKLLGDAAQETLIPEVSAPAGFQHSAFRIQHLTLRVPDQPVTQDILSAAWSAGMPIAIIGGALPNTPLADDPAAIPAALLDHLAALVDAGPTRYRKPSTLVRIAGERIEVLRPGVIDERIIHRLADQLILFVCSGNTCRSPMASAIAAKILADRLGTTPDKLATKHVAVQSAGLHAARGLRAAWEAVVAVQDKGLDLSGHLSQPATPELLRRADVIYTMTDAHRDEILDLYPAAARKTSRLDPEADIDDPIGSDETVYRQVAAHLEAVLQRRLSELSL